MKKLAALLFAVILCSTAFAADRIYTNPKPDAALKQLFPNAGFFSARPWRNSTFR